MNENTEKPIATAENQNIFLSGVNHTFATVIDNNSKNKHVNGAKVRIDSSNNEKVRILNQQQIRELFEAKSTITTRHRRIKTGNAQSDAVQYHRFEQYCQSHCLNRKLYFVDMNLNAHFIDKLSHILQQNTN